MDRPPVVPLKAAKSGIKSYELCKYGMGYVRSFTTYTGQDMELTNQFVNSHKNKIAVVITLVKHLLGHGHTLWMVNFYNSLELACALKSKGTLCWHPMCQQQKKKFLMR